MIRKHTLIGAAGAAALTIGAIASPASAAPKVVSYSCFGGAITIPITMDAGTLPTKMVAGQKVTKAISGGNIHLASAVVDIALGQPWDAVTANTVSKSGTPYSLKIAKTTLPNPSADMDIPATGSFTIRPVASGTYKVRAGNMTANIQGWLAGVKKNLIPLDCVAPTDGSNVFGSIAVAKDTSKTTVKGSYAKAKKTATGVAVVKGRNFGLAGKGSVKMTLKRGTAKIKTITVKLNSKGVAKGVFKSVTKHGKYKIVTVFGGSAGLKASSGTSATFTV